MPYYHLTASLGRADTLTVEAESKSKLLTFFGNVSESVVRNIKEIVFSKALNINYVPSYFVEGTVYHRVIVQAMSENYAETYVLFNVRSTVTEDDIIRQFKKLLINNEPIIDFISIQFFNEGDSPTNIDNLYQVQYKRNSKTYIENLYAKDWQSAKDLVDVLIDGEILEVRKFVYIDETIKKDRGDYHKGVGVYYSNSEQYRSFRIPKLKLNLSHNFILNQIATTFKIGGVHPNIDTIKLSYR